MLNNIFNKHKIFFVFAFFLGCYFIYSTISNDKTKDTIQSDGRGYYAYLPALFIYGDNSYQASLNAEKVEYGSDFTPLYLFKDINGKTYNKFFPGVAMMQAPFFAAACVCSWLRGKTIDGYSGEFQFFFYLGSVFYAFIGLLFLIKSLKLLFPNDSKGRIILITTIYLATPLLLYSTELPSYSHVYSFSLFVLFTYVLLRIKEKQTTIRVFTLAIILGCIFLVRPTNLIIILSIPFILGDWKSLQIFLTKLFKGFGKQFVTGIIGFLSIASILFILWKWQTGNWIAWSYNGEGFNFLHPHLFDSLFSFRIGLLIHTPVLLLCIVGLYYWRKENHFASISWLVYFLLNSWIIASWWCWDYESTFGNRPYTEHLFFLIIPLFYFIQKYYRLSLMLISILSIIFLIRFGQFTSGSNQLQRFYADSYFPSLQFWKENNKGRWQFTQSCKPYGKMIKQDFLLKKEAKTTITELNEYLFTSSKDFLPSRTNERFLLRVELDKKVEEIPLKDVFIVIDATSSNNNKRSYQAIELFNDRYEGQENWNHFVLETQVYDPFHELDQVSVYLWNKSRSILELKNVSFVLETYKAD